MSVSIITPLNNNVTPTLVGTVVDGTAFSFIFTVTVDGAAYPFNTLLPDSSIDGPMYTPALVSLKTLYSWIKTSTTQINNYKLEMKITFTPPYTYSSTTLIFEVDYLEDINDPVFPGYINIPKRYYQINFTVPCIGSNTNILMNNGMQKKIQDIKRGDIILSDKEYVVARVNKNEVNHDSVLDICNFSEGSIGDNIPFNKLIITAAHPIIHHETKSRRQSIAFSNNPGVTTYKQCKAHEVLPSIIINEEHKYYLWDLQFETVGSYFANGVLVQSRSPRSCNTPLPKELFFNQELYDELRYDDYEPNYEYPLILEKL